MFIVRDIFHLKFGAYRDVKSVMDTYAQSGLFAQRAGFRMLTDFTGDSYRFIFEMGFTSLSEYEAMMAGEMSKPEWREWYAAFKPHVLTSHREILKQVM